MKKCNKCKEGKQSIKFGSGRLKCECEVYLDNLVESFKPFNDMIDDMLGINKKEKE
tara:strand:- start:1844 stop:2011 length:168 start_codon:yes stop_codon:yes gene_type:complete